MGWVRINLPFGLDADRGPDFERPCGMQMYKCGHDCLSPTHRSSSGPLRITMHLFCVTLAGVSMCKLSLRFEMIQIILSAAAKVFKLALSKV